MTATVTSINRRCFSCQDTRVVRRGPWGSDACPQCASAAELEYQARIVEKSRPRARVVKMKGRKRA